MLHLFKDFYSFKNFLIKSPIRPLAGAIYHLLVWIELLSISMIDRIRLNTEELGSISLDQVTALVKTFERPAVLRRLLQSIRRFYPDLKVVVVNDSRESIPIEGVEWVPLPFDSGVSKGRSVGLSRIKTPFILLLDDDFIFYRKTGLREALGEIEKYPEIDIMGGVVEKLPFFTKGDYSYGGMYHTEAESLYLKGSKIGPYPVYDKVPNFYIARTERLRLVDWDPRIKRIDHAEFFTRAKGVLTTVMNNRLRCLHANTPFDRHYMKYREDHREDMKVIHQKFYPDL